MLPSLIAVCDSSVIIPIKVCPPPQSPFCVCLLQFLFPSFGAFDSYACAVE